MTRNQHLPPGDRATMVPSHTGENVFPNLPFFEKLLRFAHRSPPRIAIRDVNLGVEKTYLQLFTDAIALRSVLRRTLNADVLQEIYHGHEVFIALIAPGGYEYAVAFIAIIALGAAVVPITPALPVEEAKSLVVRSGCVAIISSDSATSLAQRIATSLSPSQTIATLPIAPSLRSTPLPATSITISSNPVPNINTAALVIFTSGTTGPPKGAVQRRSYLTSAAEDVADQYRITEEDTVLHVLPVHHATGIGITFLPFLMSGACVEFRSGSFDPAWTWERWKRVGITVFSGVPTIYMRMMRYFETHISALPMVEQRAYIDGARMLRVLLCGTSALPKPVCDFWSGILDGRSILTRYGGTEFHAVLKAGLDGGTPVNSVGTVSPGVSLKLTEEGMILVKGPNLFSKYLNDEAATASAHDSEGYFITGDIARREGNNYFILGRASIDIIKSGGYKLSALDIEREILGLDYIGEVMVVGVEDEEFGQRVAAAVTLKEGMLKKGLSLARLRSDLRERLAGYKMPTVLRVLEGEIPKSGTGKVQKKMLGPRYFGDAYRGDPGVQVWEKEVKAKL
ncbi:hypothetical protein ASPCAL07757 [Aspergillus calidoustus]|uniref:Uncharacterized protein n=1 Tax=Aspergillus calidoustus TaxID=454130 RepID=A0A0U5GV75_ASPCI|nr:hypothetical protein ASPCAL07757 [Aspergillus calidoustus]